MLQGGFYERSQSTVGTMLLVVLITVSVSTSQVNCLLGITGFRIKYWKNQRFEHTTEGKGPGQRRVDSKKLVSPCPPKYFARLIEGVMLSELTVLQVLAYLSTESSAIQYQCT